MSRSKFWRFLVWLGIGRETEIDSTTQLFKEGRCAMNLELSETESSLRSSYVNSSSKGRLRICGGGAVLLACRWSVWDA